MRKAILAVAAVAVVASLFSPAAAETAVAGCSASTALVPGTDNSDSFSFTACTDIGANWSLVRNGTFDTAWTVSTPRGSTSCTWKSGEAAVCTGSRPVPARAGDRVSVTITLSNNTCTRGCVLVGNWGERPQLT